MLPCFHNDGRIAGIRELSHRFFKENEHLIDLLVGRKLHVHIKLDKGIVLHQSAKLIYTILGQKWSISRSREILRKLTQ